MSWLPVLHRIIVKQDKLEEKDKDYARASKSGIYIPNLDEKSREQAAIDTGTVVAIGSTAFKDFGTDSPIVVGDYVVFAKHAGKTLVDPDTDEKFVALNDEDIIAKLSKEPQNG
jgi:co-chaperonin GroES (HSP10)